MTNRTAARRYARALFDVAVAEKADLEHIEQDLAGIAGLFEQHPTLQHVLLNPAVPAPRKHALVAELTSRMQIAGAVAKLLALLAERDRLVLVPDLLADYRERLLETKNIVRGELTTATPLAEEQTQAIARTLTQATGRTVMLEAKVDPSIVGGLVARVGSTVYDGSVTRQLEKMKQRLAENV